MDNRLYQIWMEQILTLQVCKNELVVVSGSKEVVGGGWKSDRSNIGRVRSKSLNGSTASNVVERTNRIFVTTHQQTAARIYAHGGDGRTLQEWKPFMYCFQNRVRSPALRLPPQILVGCHFEIRRTLSNDALGVVSGILTPRPYLNFKKPYRFSGCGSRGDDINAAPSPQVPKTNRAILRPRNKHGSSPGVQGQDMTCGQKWTVISHSLFASDFIKLTKTFGGTFQHAKS